MIDRNRNLPAFRAPQPLGRPALAALACAALLLPGETAGQEDSVRLKMTIRSTLDFGHIVNGSIPTQYAKPINLSPDVSMLPLNRANVLAIQEAAIGRFDVSAGLAGLIWWPYGGGITDASERAINVKPMVPVARARWQFGDPQANSGMLQIGTFNHKYNPDAKNLGEYLYRAGTYPGFLWTNEGWLLMNRAGNYSHGAMLSMVHLGGMFKQNLSLFMETNYYPVGDFSPGYDFTVAGKWLEAGGGAVLHHYLPLRPSALTPKDDENTFIRARKIDPATGDTTLFNGPRAQSPLDLEFDPDVQWRVEHRWTHKGIKLMGRAALNLGHLLPDAAGKPEDLRLFAEAAVLGVEDQPLYYEKIEERIPVMFGITLPTFKLLDALTLQGEYYKSPYNDINFFNTKSLPIWTTDFAVDSTTLKVMTDADGQVIPEKNHQDDFKWTVHAKKSVNRLLTVYAQAGSDHFRLTTGLFKASSVPLTATPSEWYYLIRMEFALR